MRSSGRLTQYVAERHLAVEPAAKDDMDVRHVGHLAIERGPGAPRLGRCLHVSVATIRMKPPKMGDRLAQQICPPFRRGRLLFRGALVSLPAIHVAVQMLVHHDRAQRRGRHRAPHRKHLAVAIPHRQLLAMASRRARRLGGGKLPFGYPDDRANCRAATRAESHHAGQPPCLRVPVVWRGGVARSARSIRRMNARCQGERGGKEGRGPVGGHPWCPSHTDPARQKTARPIGRRAIQTAVTTAWRHPALPITACLLFRPL